MAFTTGYMTNTRDFGTACSNVVVNLVNEDTVNAATVTIQIFFSLVPDTKTPLYVTSVNLPANSIARRTFFIQGVLAYEVQYNVASAAPANVVLSNFGLDQFGNVVQEHRVLQSELTTIPALSPVI
ncbi:hypothetical protein A7311_07220 [Paenibacillus polymyxa]|uniref:Uncharacterized protein n=1 Tax=Paenibacillus polymyxa TaxID=1406 RepID=A0A8I1LQL3_PAEPO|nr:MULTISPECIES: hypothetical protein [Paenibacillus]KAF6587598.1 hypothetical protein G9G52_17800 [Paenibacillus sp. EKM205P]KAF6572938.1 hypothetical protein G9G53_14755 [Paenibacillus sp. EKM206P]KYG94730.1 hypothetical protein AZE31_13035 [Paenibacillus polymyxa]MBM0633789.1 hypothetical protein [Paenibacillus polymyxa]MBO3285754.1 hypothetical protein [Paenibacillus polymyxa]